MPLAIFAVTDKSGIVDFGRALDGLGWRLAGTTGTAALLRKNDVPCTSVIDMAETQELFGGRLKTLHPVIFGGLLYRRGHVQDEAEAARYGIPTIDLLAGNFYRFESFVAAEHRSRDEALQYIDIGGPAMMRAAAKNHPSVIPLVDPNDYSAVSAALTAGGGSATAVNDSMRLMLAVKAFEHCERYDAAIGAYLRSLR